MKRPKRHDVRVVTASLVVAVVLITMAGFAPAQAPEARPALASLAEDAQRLVLGWLNRDCGADDKRVLEEQLEAIGARLEPVFWEAYRLGPSAENLESDRENFRQRYQERQAWLADEGRRLFGDQEADRLMKVPVEQYAQRETENMVAGYKTAAVLGLGLAGTQGSLPELERLAEDPENPTSVAARQAIAAIKARNRQSP